ncbi:MAG: hypothetical protein Q8R00_00205 [Candidatus Nanoarchaeia archaeon]|nr:hypothetical protein [Candidatus Nanoarchaeia archaeon]
MRTKVLQDFADDEFNPERLAQASIDLTKSMKYHGDRKKQREDLERILALSGLDVDLSSLFNPNQELYHGEIENQELFEKLKQLGLTGTFFNNGKLVYLYDNEQNKPDENRIRTLLNNYTESSMSNRINQVEQKYRDKTAHRIKQARNKYKTELQTQTETLNRLEDALQTQTNSPKGDTYIFNYHAPVNYGTINFDVGAPTEFSRQERIRSTEGAVPTHGHRPSFSNEEPYCSLQREPSETYATEEPVVIKPENLDKKIESEKSKLNRNESNFSVWPIMMLASFLLLL